MNEIGETESSIPNELRANWQRLRADLVNGTPQGIQPSALLLGVDDAMWQQIRGSLSQSAQDRALVVTDD